MKASRLIPQRPQGFSRADCLVLALALMVVVMVILPALADTRSAGAFAICANNLRRIGVAYQNWGDQISEHRPYRTPIEQGGLRLHPLAGNAWVQFAAISNELESPRVLVCPANVTRRTARDFTTNPDGGLLASAQRNNAVAYFVGSDSTPSAPHSIVAGDINIQTAGYAACSVVDRVSYLNLLSGQTTRFWTNAIHGTGGNLLRFDGAVFSSFEPNTLPALRLDGGRPSLHMVTP